MTDYKKLADLFKMFGDETRVRIIDVLSNGEMSVGEIAKSLDMTDSAISHQLSMLKARRLIKARRDGKSIYYSIDCPHICGILSNGKDHISEEIQ